MTEISHGKLVKYLLSMNLALTLRRKCINYANESILVHVSVYLLIINE